LIGEFELAYIVQTVKLILSVCTCLVRRQDKSLVLQKLKNASFMGGFDVLACNHPGSDWLLINLERLYS